MRFYSNVFFSTICALFSLQFNFCYSQIEFSVVGEGSSNAGNSVHMPNSSTLAIASRDLSGYGQGVGHVRVYKLVGGAWIQKGVDIDAEPTFLLSEFKVNMPDENTIAVGAPLNNGNGSKSGHVRIYKWSGSNWIQKGKDILGENSGDSSGFSISMPDSNTIAIGAPMNNSKGIDAGHVRVYSWSGSAWVQKGIDIDGKSSGDWFGYSLSMPNPDIIAIGAPLKSDIYKWAGQVSVYTWDGVKWTILGSAINGKALGDGFGVSVSITGNLTLAIGASANDAGGNASGQVRVFEWNGVSWNQKGADLVGIANEYSGHFVAMPSDNVVAIGAPGVIDSRYSTSGGRVAIYMWDGISWKKKGLTISGKGNSRYGWSLSMPDENSIAIGAPNDFLSNGDTAKVIFFVWNGIAWIQKGSEITVPSMNSSLGWSISMPNPNIVAGGAPYNDGNGVNSGSVRIYLRAGKNMLVKGKEIDGEFQNDCFGWSVSMPDGNTIGIGAPFNDGNGNNSGHTRVYAWNGNSWIQKGVDIDGELTNDSSGWVVSMPNSNTIAIGAPFNDGNGNNSGHVRIYSWNGVKWIQKGKDIDGLNPGDKCGYSVSMPDENTIAIGSPGYKINSVSAGNTRVFSWNGFSWIQKGANFDGQGNQYEYFGSSVNMPNANTLAIGANKESFVYVWNGSNWAQKGDAIVNDCDGIYSNWIDRMIVDMGDENIILITSRITSCGGDNGVWEWKNNSWEQRMTAPHVTGSYSSISMPDANSCAIASSGNPANGFQSGLINVYPCKRTEQIQKVVACESFKWIDGITYSNSINTPVHNLKSFLGCDSVIKLNLTIVPKPDKVVIVNGAAITSNDTGGNYSWVYCDSNYKNIPGATFQTFIAKQNGRYAVIVDNGTCSDTSACVTISSFTNIYRLSNTNVTVYPNPTRGNFTVQFDRIQNQIVLALYNMSGQLIKSQTNRNSNVVNIEMGDISSGVYVLKLKDNENQEIQIKVTKE
jgi:hypothetical protein